MYRKNVFQPAGIRHTHQVRLFDTILLNTTRIIKSEQVSKEKNLRYK